MFFKKYYTPPYNLPVVLPWVNLIFAPLLNLFQLKFTIIRLSYEYVNFQLSNRYYCVSWNHGRIRNDHWQEERLQC